MSEINQTGEDLVDAILKQQVLRENLTFTENGAVTNKSTLSPTLDLFGLGGAQRRSTKEDRQSLFSLAYHEDKLIALKILFYLRDVRGGQGERQMFRDCIEWLAINDPATLLGNLTLIPEFGRWDDVYILAGTPLEVDAFKLFAKQITEDKESDSPSLCAKWLKSINTSSKESRRLGELTRRYFRMTPKGYRKLLSGLREKIDIVETHVSQGKYFDIDYNRVPSKAALKYRHAFQNNDNARYNAYLDKVNKGEAKINTGTLYPYDIVEKFLYSDVRCGAYEKFSYSNYGIQTEEQPDDLTLNVAWDNLPDYLAGNNHNGLVVADVSGSMNGRPMAVSISLAMYFAERNKGIFNNHFMTFSAEPTLEKVTGDTLREKISNLHSAKWGMNTNLQAVFKTILHVAQANLIDQDEMPDRIYIVSDMEFDRCVRGRNLDSIKHEYALNGYEMPEIVFWNVNSRSKQVPITVNEEGVCLVSGCSPVILTKMLQSEVISPMQVMLDVINDERYDCITV